MTTPESTPLNYALKFVEDREWGSAEVRRARTDGRRPRPIDSEIVERVRIAYISHHAILHPIPASREPFVSRVKRVLNKRRGG